MEKRLHRTLKGMEASKVLTWVPDENTLHYMRYMAQEDD